MVAHADWSKDPGKRWCATAVRDPDGRYRAETPAPVGNLSTDFDRLRQRAGGGSLLGERCGMRVAGYRRHEGPAAACAAATRAPSASSSAGAHAACIRSKSPRSSLWMWALSR